MDSQFLITANPGLFNKGYATLLEGLFDCMRTTGNAEITIFSSRSDYDRRRCDARTVGFDNKSLTRAGKFYKRMRYPQYLLLALVYRATGKYLSGNRLVIANSLWEAYCGCDVVIAGMDDSFTTLQGPSSFYTSCFNIVCGKLLKKRVVLYGCTIGPMKKKRHEILAKHILNLPDLITVREDRSREYLRKIGVTNPGLHVTADFSFAADVASSGRIDEIMRNEGILGEESKPLIGVSFSRNVASGAFPGAGDKHERFRRFIALAGKLLDELVERAGATIVFLPYATGPCDYHDERIIHRYFREAMRHKDRTVLVEGDYMPGELIGLIGECDFYIGGHVHAAISAAMMRVPFIALEDESFTTRGIIGNMMGCEDRICRIEDLDDGRLLSRIIEDQGRREEIKKDLAAKTAGMKGKALMNAVLLEELMSRNGAAKRR